MPRSLFLLLFFVAIIVSAQPSRNIGGVRQLSMAGSGLCLPDLWSANGNQACLVFLSGSQAGFYAVNSFLSPELSSGGFAAAAPLKWGALGLSWSRTGVSLFRESALGASVSKKISAKVSVAAKLNYHTLSIGDIYGRANWLSGEASIYAVLTNQLRTGVRIVNPTRTGPLSQKNSGQGFVSVGLGYFPSSRLTLLFELEKKYVGMPVLRAGAEYYPNSRFFIRGGLSTNASQNAVGFGIAWRRLKLDLGAGFHPRLGYSPMLGLSATF